MLDFSTVYRAHKVEFRLHAAALFVRKLSTSFSSVIALLLLNIIDYFFLGAWFWLLFNKVYTSLYIYFIVCITMFSKE